MGIRFELILVAAALMSFIATGYFYNKVLKVAKVSKAMDNPNKRKLQSNPIPVLGGFVVFFGILCGLLFAGAILKTIDNTGVYENASKLYYLCGLQPVVVAGAIMLFTGCIDDLIGLTPRFRLIMECLAVLGMCLCSGQCVDSLFGLFGINAFSWWIGLPLTVLIGVGIINAYNMVDGVDGLSSGLCITTAPVIMWLFLKRNDGVDAVLMICYMASLIPFFLHNVFGKRSRMFIGDAGTMLMGTLFTWCMIQTLSVDGVMANLKETDPDAVMCLPAMLFAIASVPVMDTLRVMVHRKIHGTSVFQADRSHLHHKFIDAGVGHFMTSVFEILLNVLVMLVWYVTYKLGILMVGQLIATVIAAVFLVWGTYFFLNYRRCYNIGFVRFMQKISILSHLEKTSVWRHIQKYVDRTSYREDLIDLVKDSFFVSHGKPLSNKKMKMVEVLYYMQYRKDTKVEKIIKNLNIEPKNVQQILSEMEQGGMIEVLDREHNGNILSLKLSRRAVLDR